MIESDLQGSMKQMTDLVNNTQSMLFSSTQKELLEVTQQWLKYISSSAIVVTAYTVTDMQPNLQYQEETMTTTSHHSYTMQSLFSSPYQLN